MKVLLAEADPKLRYAISVLVHEQPGWTVVSSIEDICELADTLKSNRPDILIIDLDMPGAKHDEIEEVIKGKDIRVIFLVSIPFHRTPSTSGTNSNRIWISKIESPEILLHIFQSFVNSKAE